MWELVRVSVQKGFGKTLDRSQETETDPGFLHRARCDDCRPSFTFAKWSSVSAEGGSNERSGRMLGGPNSQFTIYGSSSLLPVSLDLSSHLSLSLSHVFLVSFHPSLPLSASLPHRR